MYVKEQAEQQNGQYFLPVLEASVHVTANGVHTNIKPPWFKCSIHQFLLDKINAWR